METATQACLALGLPEVHVCWDLSEALFRIRDAPEGPLCEWLRGPPAAASAVGPGPPAAEAPPYEAREGSPAAASICEVGQEPSSAAAASLCEVGTRSRDDGDVTYADAEEGAVPVKVQGLEWMLASEGLEQRSWSPGDAEPARGGAVVAEAPLCRCILPCAASTATPPAAGDAACPASQQQPLQEPAAAVAESLPLAAQQHPHEPDAVGGSLPLAALQPLQEPAAAVGESLPLAAQRPPLFAHCCPCSPEAAERAYERYGRALADLADASPAGETILFVTHGE